MFHANRASILHQDQHYLQTDQTELSLEPLDLGVPSGASKMVSYPLVHQVQTVHLSCTETNTVSKQDFVWHTSSRSSIMCLEIDFQAFGMFHANRAPILHQDQHYLQTDRTKHQLEILHLGVPTRASKMVAQTMVHQVQSVHLSCIKTNNVSKWTEARFHMTHVIKEFHWVRSN